MRRASKLAILLSVTAVSAHAQILKVPPRSGGGSGGSIRPVFVGASIGYAISNVVNDGKTESSWNFGSGAQYRGSLEVGLGNQSSIGVTVTHVRMPLTYQSSATPLPAGCSRCDAHANIQSALLSFHAGGGAGFHQVIEAGIGFLRYGKFRADDGDAELPPNADTDFMFSVGYGFGYGLSSSLAIFVVQDYMTSLHQRTGLSGSARGNNQHYTTRVGVRFGFGDTTR